MPIIYGSVWRGMQLLAQHAEFEGNFAQVAQDHLAAAGRNGGHYTYVIDAYTFNFYCHDGLVYLAVADQPYGRAIPHAVLTKMQQEYAAFTATHKGDTAAFGKTIRGLIREASTSPEAFTSIARVQGKVDEVKTVMLSNIDKVLDRGKKLDNLADKTDELVMQADGFMRKGRELSHRMWCQNFKMKLVMAFAVVLLAIVVFLLVCFSGRNCLKKKA